MYLCADVYFGFSTPSVVGTASGALRRGARFKAWLGMGGNTSIVASAGTSIPEKALSTYLASRLAT
jgi:hypothetical protein